VTKKTTTLSAIIENVTHGSLRTVEFSFPIGTNELTSATKIIIRIRIRMFMGKKPRGEPFAKGTNERRASFWKLCELGG
jgi:hypothetical protein